MKFRNYFLLSSFAFVSTGFLALVLTGRLDLISPVLYVAAVVSAWWIERSHSSSRAGSAPRTPRK